jgi:hypothetical protein
MYGEEKGGAKMLSKRSARRRLLKLVPREILLTMSGQPDNSREEDIIEYIIDNCWDSDLVRIEVDKIIGTAD